MNREQPSSPEKRRPRVSVQFGLGGHESEYVITLSNQSKSTEDLMIDFSDSLEEKLGPTWEVSYRTTRIEVRSKQPYGKRDDDLIRDAVQTSIGESHDLIGL